MIDSNSNAPLNVISLDYSTMNLIVQSSDSFQSGRYAMKVRATNN